MRFRRLTDDDLPLLHGWLQEEGVVRWWEGDDVSWDAVVADHGSGSDPAYEHWLVCADSGRPLGWLQCYPVAHVPEEAEEWWAAGVHRDAAGIDYLLGDPASRGRGLGSLAIGRFAREVVLAGHPGWTQVCAAPYEANVASWRAMEKAGFRHVATLPDPDGPCRLMVLDRREVEAEARKGAEPTPGRGGAGT